MGFNVMFASLSFDIQMLRGIKIHFSSEPKFYEKCWTYQSLSKKIEHKAYKNLLIVCERKGAEQTLQKVIRLQGTLATLVYYQ